MSVRHRRSSRSRPALLVGLPLVAMLNAGCVLALLAAGGPVKPTFGEGTTPGITFAEDGRRVVAELVSVRDASESKFSSRWRGLLMEAPDAAPPGGPEPLPPPSERTAALAKLLYDTYPRHRDWDAIEREARVHHAGYGAGGPAFVVGTRPLAVAWSAEPQALARASDPADPTPPGNADGSGSAGTRLPTFVYGERLGRRVNCLLVFAPGPLGDPRFVTADPPIPLDAVIDLVAGGSAPDGVRLRERAVPPSRRDAAGLDRARGASDGETAYE